MHFYQNSKVRGKILFLMIGMSILFIIPNIVTLALVGSSGDVASLLHVLVPVDIVYLALLLVFYALAAVRFSKRVTRSTTEIVRAAEDLAEGKTRIHIDYAGSDELGAASESMNHLSERISGAIQEVIRILSSIEKGNFNVETQYHWTGDWAQLNTTLKGITDSLNRIFSKINDASDQTASGSEQVASAAQALAQGATEQASSIQELSATIMEVSEHVKKNASNATDADRASVTAKEKINQADQNMREMMQAMTQISESSKKIGNIIKTIDDIAFQTNILALNAAVEAARAGSAGKGFAVVADEVRNLASKSAEAAKNTTALIEDSIKAVTNGSKIAGVTEQTLVEVQTAAGESNRLVNEIAKASNQQATSIGQITQGVQQISAVVQTNSATAEQSAAASEELAAQAKLLKRTISGIQLKESHNAASVKKAPDAKKEERVSAEAKPQKAEAASKMKPNDKYI